MEVIRLRNIGTEMKCKRKELGYTMQDIADYVGVSKGTVAKWENGSIDNIKRDKIEKLSQILKVSPIFFVNDDYNESESEKNIYYLDDKSAKYAQEIAENSSLHALFSAARNAKKEDLETVINLLNRLKGN